MKNTEASSRWNWCSDMQWWALCSEAVSA